MVASEGGKPLIWIKNNHVSLTDHYYEYLQSPAVAAVLCILIGPLLYSLAQQTFRRPRSPVKRKQDLYRLGLSKRSNLDEQSRPPSETSDARVKALFTYPIKSCRGIELAASEVGATGLKYDRLFTFAQLVSSPDESRQPRSRKQAVNHDWKHEWRFITQREFPRLALLRTELWVPSRKSQDPMKKRKKSSWAGNGGCVAVRFPLEPGFNPFGLRTETMTFRVPLMPSSEWARNRGYSRETMTIWKDQASAINVTNDIPPDTLEKLKSFLGVSNTLGLFRVDDRNRRAVTRSLPKDRPEESYSVGFGDAFPLHILSLASVRAIAKDLPDKSKDRGRLDAKRFRANIYLDGVPAYEEDEWKKVHIGRCIKRISDQRSFEETDGEYHVACRTARCTLPNVDQDSGVRDANEPYTALGKTRKVDKGAYPHPCLGMQMIPLFQQGLLRVGDEVKVVETGEHSYEKMFG
ncbi:uncharacterized protein LTR77_010827 [Saxophila tyrrhenica]|uniref:MOSC domain-containing protein n=1 Tax=Saxophila tyrrhenica TaxID=1690608 RepID=A0AAV9NYA1_9PEZI|nr:hypothetical protein LTR77_010827 [Saxophila tyrrhenica]